MIVLTYALVKKHWYYKKYILLYITRKYQILFIYFTDLSNTSFLYRNVNIVQYNTRIENITDNVSLWWHNWYKISWIVFHFLYNNGISKLLVFFFCEFIRYFQFSSLPFFDPPTFDTRITDKWLIFLKIKIALSMVARITSFTLINLKNITTCSRLLSK